MLWMHMGHDTRRLGRGLPGNRNILAWVFFFFWFLWFDHISESVGECFCIFICVFLSCFLTFKSAVLFPLPSHVFMFDAYDNTLCYLLVNSCSGAAGKMVPEETVTTGGILRDSGSLSLLLAQSDRLFLPGRLSTSGGIPGVADPGR